MKTASMVSLLSSSTCTQTLVKKDSLFFFQKNWFFFPRNCWMYHFCFLCRLVWKIEEFPWKMTVKIWIVWNWIAYFLKMNKFKCECIPFCFINKGIWCTTDVKPLKVLFLFLFHFLLLVFGLLIGIMDFAVCICQVPDFNISFKLHLTMCIILNNKLTIKSTWTKLLFTH